MPDVAREVLAVAGDPRRSGLTEAAPGAVHEIDALDVAHVEAGGFNGGLRGEVERHTLEAVGIDAEFEGASHHIRRFLDAPRLERTHQILGRCGRSWAAQHQP